MAGIATYEPPATASGGLTDDTRLTPMATKVLAFVFLAWVVDAADSTIYSLTLPLIKDEFGLSLTTMGMIASIFLAGTVLGSLVLPAFAESKGRRYGMVACIGIFSFFTGFVGLVGSAFALATARFFTGCGTGAEWPIGAAYLSEMVPAKRRGLFMGFMQAGYPVGYFLAGGIFATFSALGLGWRACYVVLALPVVMCFPIIMQLKESPTWLARHRGKAGPANAGVATVVTEKRSIRELFAPRYLHFTLIATALHVFGAIFSYGLVVWVPSAIAIDFHIEKVQVAQFVMFAWGVGTFGYLLVGFLADRFGRKPVLALYTLLGLVAVLYLNHLKGALGITLVDLLVPGMLIGISLGVSATYMTYASEIYPAHLRTTGLGFSVAVGKMTAVFVPTVLGMVAQASSISAALLVSTLLGMLMIPVILCGPETARKPLDSIVQ